MVTARRGSQLRERHRADFNTLACVSRNFREIGGMDGFSARKWLERNRVENNDTTHRTIINQKEQQGRKSSP
jgi:hypothetical protein